MKFELHNVISEIREMNYILDNLTAKQRRKNMQHIKNKDTLIELKLRKKLWNKGYRYCYLIWIVQKVLIVHCLHR